MNPSTAGQLPSTELKTPVPQSPRSDLEVPPSGLSSRSKWLIGSAVVGLILAGGTFAYSKYQQYKERAKKDKIFKSKSAQKYKKKHAAFHADG